MTPEQHTSDNKGGRPRIGTPVTITIPDDVLAAIKARADERGITRADQIRDLVTGADRMGGGDRPADDGRTRLVQPAAALLSGWIGADPDNRDQARGRFNHYRRAAGNGYRLVQLIERVWGHLYLSGVRDMPLPSPEALTQLGRDWQARALLFFTVMSDLTSAGVVLGPANAGEDDDGEEIDFSPKPPDEADEEQWA